MSSELTRADLLIQHLTDSLRAVLPTGWKVVDAEAGASKSLGTVLYYEQMDVSNEMNSVPLGPGFVGVDFMLTLTAPQSDPEKGTRMVTAALLELLPALDSLEDLYWGPTAEKARLETGETSYRIPVTFISTYLSLTPTPEEE